MIKYDLNNINGVYYMRSWIKMDKKLLLHIIGMTRQGFYESTREKSQICRSGFENDIV